MKFHYTVETVGCPKLLGGRYVKVLYVHEIRMMGAGDDTVRKRRLGRRSCRKNTKGGIHDEYCN